MKNLRNQNVTGERERDEKFSTFKNYKQVFGWILQWIEDKMGFCPFWAK